MNERYELPAPSAVQEVIAEMRTFERQLRFGTLRARRRGVTERVSAWADRLEALLSVDPPQTSTSGQDVIDNFAESFDQRFWRVLNDPASDDVYVSRQEAQRWRRRIEDLRKALLTPPGRAQEDPCNCPGDYERYYVDAQGTTQKDRHNNHCPKSACYKAASTSGGSSQTEQELWEKAGELVATATKPADAFTPQQVVFYALRDAGKPSGIALCLNGVLWLVSRLRTLEASLSSDQQTEKEPASHPVGWQPQWEPIANAPKDGRPLLLFWRDDYGRSLDWIGVGNYQRFIDGSAGWVGSSIWCSEKGSWTSICGNKVTHWMPLPLPPGGSSPQPT